MEAASKRSPTATLDTAKRIIQHEANALKEVADHLGSDFLQAVDELEACPGAVVVTGMGKAGLVGQKISATLCSTGTRSFFLHPAEAIHGDLGRVTKQDKVLALSMSGETEELVRVLPSLEAMADGVVSITSRRLSSLGRHSRVVVELGLLQEACGIGLAPSTSTTAMLALGDALALTLSERRGFQPGDFIRFHPGGSLGKKLTRVTEIMRSLVDCRVASDAYSLRETFVTLRRSGRRTGAVMIVDNQQKLVGVFTDSDLARLLEAQADASLDSPVRDVMTRSPITIGATAMMHAAIRLLAENQISELPVVDGDGRPVGMIDITDVITWLPPKETVEPADTKPNPKLLPFPRDQK